MPASSTRKRRGLFYIPPQLSDSDDEDGDEPGATLVAWVLSGDADDEASRKS